MKKSILLALVALFGSVSAFANDEVAAELEKEAVEVAVEAPEAESNTAELSSDTE